MYYIPSITPFKSLQVPSDLYAYGPFLCYRSLAPLEHHALPGCLLQFPLKMMIAAETQTETPISPNIKEVDSSLDASVIDKNSASLGPYTSILPPDPEIRPGYAALLISMGLVPNPNQESVKNNIPYYPWTTDEDEDEDELEIEIFRNNMDDASRWEETSTYDTEERTSEDASVDLPHGPENRAWLPRASPDNIFSRSMIFSSPKERLASSSFFGDMLASSSSPNMRSAEALRCCTPEFDLPSFSFSISSERLAGADRSEDDIDIQGNDSFELLAEQDSEDLIPSASFSPYFPEMEPNTSFSFEVDFPLLPSKSEVAEFLKGETTPSLDVHDLTFDPPSFSLDSEHLINTSIPLAGDISSASISSLAMPSFSSMESLLRISLDIPDLSLSASFSSCISLCEIPTLPSLDDLARVEPPPGLDMDIEEGDDDAFRPLPPDAKSPFNTPTALDSPNPSKDDGPPKRTYRKARPSLPTLYENY